MDKYIVKFSELDSDYFETISSVKGYFYQDYADHHLLKIKWETEPPNQIEFNLFIFNTFDTKRRKMISERGLEQTMFSQLYKTEMINENELGLRLLLKSKRDVYKHLLLHFMFANKISAYLQSSLLYKDDPCELKRDIPDPILNVSAEDRINERQITCPMQQTMRVVQEDDKEIEADAGMLSEEETREDNDSADEAIDEDESEEDESEEEDESDDDILKEKGKQVNVKTSSAVSRSQRQPRVLMKRKNHLNENLVDEKRAHSTPHEEYKNHEIKNPSQATKRKENPVETVKKRIRKSDAESVVSNYNHSSISVGDLTEKEWGKVRENLYAMTNLILNNRQDLVKPFITNLKKLLPTFNFNSMQTIENQDIKDALNADTCRHTTQSLEYLFNKVISKYNADRGLNATPSIISATVINQITDIMIDDDVDLNATLTNEHVNLSQKVSGQVDVSTSDNQPVAAVHNIIVPPAWSLSPPKLKVPSPSDSIPASPPKLTVPSSNDSGHPIIENENVPTISGYIPASTRRQKRQSSDYIPASTRKQKRPSSDVSPKCTKVPIPPVDKEKASTSGYIPVSTQTQKRPSKEKVPSLIVSDVMGEQENEKVPSLFGSDVVMGDHTLASLPDYTGFVVDVPRQDFFPLSSHDIDPTLAQQPLPASSSSDVSMLSLKGLDNLYDPDRSLYEDMETSISDATFIDLVHTVWQKITTQGITQEVSTIVDRLFQLISHNYSDKIQMNISNLSTLYPTLSELAHFHNFVAYLYSFIQNAKVDDSYIQNAFILYKRGDTNNDYIHTLKEEILIDDTLQFSSLNELEEDYTNNRFYSLAQKMLINVKARRQSTASDESL